MFFQPCCRDQRPGRVHLRSGTGRGQDHQVRRVDKYFCSMVRWNIFRQVGPSEWGIHDDQRRRMVWLHGQRWGCGDATVREKSVSTQNWNFIRALEWGMLHRIYFYPYRSPSLPTNTRSAWHMLASKHRVINKWQRPSLVICNPFWWIIHGYNASMATTATGQCLKCLQYSIYFSYQSLMKQNCK